MNTATFVIINGVLFIFVSGLAYYFFTGMEKDPNSPNLLDPFGPNVQFFLYTRKNTDVQPDYIVLGNATSLEESNFDSKNQIKIIVHGFLSGVDQEIFVLLKDAYLKSADYNVIGVDWSALCSTDYYSAVKGVPEAAEKLSSFINWLKDSFNVNMEKIHVVGHSLGAHVAGLASDKIVNGSIGRITGLDPAGPGFKQAPEFSRLNAKDAMLVDVIHTSIQMLSLTNAIGHVDFYPNGGKEQPGCPHILENIKDNLLCNHGRAYLYFAESITHKNAFKSQRCSNLSVALNGKCYENTNVRMGQAETYVNGVYYVPTKNDPPFSYT